MRILKSQAKVRQIVGILLFLWVTLTPLLQYSVFGNDSTVVQENISLTQEEFAKAHEEVKKIKKVELGKVKTFCLDVAFLVDEKSKVPKTGKDFLKYLAKDKEEKAKDSEWNSNNSYVGQIINANETIDKTQEEFAQIAKELESGKFDALSEPVKLQKSIEKSLQAQRDHQRSVIAAGESLLSYSEQLNGFASALANVETVLTLVAAGMAATGKGLPIAAGIMEIVTTISSVRMGFKLMVSTLNMAGKSLIRSGEYGMTTDEQFSKLLKVSLPEEGAFFVGGELESRIKSKLLDKWLEIDSDALSYLQAGKLTTEAATQRIDPVAQAAKSLFGKTIPSPVNSLKKKLGESVESSLENQKVELVDEIYMNDDLKNFIEKERKAQSEKIQESIPAKKNLSLEMPITEPELNLSLPEDKEILP